ncbi:MAG: hypothetical protein KQA36_00525 [Candidatus Aenigmarchaeota archaeon]|nr:hypothetical protein [Candidatus Aenigmarchaeota archaeon]
MKRVLITFLLNAILLSFISISYAQSVILNPSEFTIQMVAGESVTKEITAIWNGNNTVKAELNVSVEAKNTNTEGFQIIYPPSIMLEPNVPKKFTIIIYAQPNLVPDTFYITLRVEVKIPVIGGDFSPTICIYDRELDIGMEANPPGVNPLNWRTSQYAFTGERIKYKIVVRDPNGALDIGYVKAFVNGSEEAIANPLQYLPYSCDGLGAPLNPMTDKAFEIIITVEDNWYGENELVLKVFDSRNNVTSATHSEEWFFNPRLGMMVATSDGQPIRFGPMDPVTRVAHSLNKIKVKNNGEGGVNLFTFIAGTDLYASQGAAKCPDSNVLEIEKYMWYRAWSGTQWQSWQGWVQMSKYNQNSGCKIKDGSYWKDINGNGVCEKNEFQGSTCYGALPIPMPNPNNQKSVMEHILTNQGLMEVEFKIQYPIPCIGTFDRGRIYIIGKAV